MKAYINKGTKIKWENSPSAPEFTDERIKAAVDTYFPVSSTEPEQGDFLMWDEDHDTWGPHTPRIDDNTDVTTNNPEDGQILVYDTNEWNNITPVLNLADDVNITNPAEGDTLVYDATAEEWKNVAPAAPLTWSALDIITADGATASFTVDAPAGTVGVCWKVYAKQATANDTVNFRVSFDGTNYVNSYTAGVAVSSAGDRYTTVYYVSDHNLYVGRGTVPNATDSGSVNLMERLETMTFTDATIQKIRIVTTNFMEADSTIQIYALHN